MAFADPQSVTINAVANSLPRTSSDATTSEYTKDDGNVSLRISHSTGRRVQRRIRLNHRKVAADPFQTGLNSEFSMSVQVIVDVPKLGYSIAEQKQIVDALVAFLSASSGAKTTQLLGGES